MHHCDRPKSQHLRSVSLELEELKRAREGCRRLRSIGVDAVCMPVHT